MARAEILGPFLDRHWRLPIPPQGPAPPHFSDAEASLDPATCGACHPKQYEEWQNSLHAGAFSPGFGGQLIEGSLAQPAELRQCQTCHAPLAEQQPYDATLAPSAIFQATLRAQGIVCASCHVRQHTRFGPRRRVDLAPAPDPIPHGGFEVRGEFQESRFCAACHQFFDEPVVNVKPVENTYAEWLASPQATDGRSCQSCHMPDRAHLWRGIHDPAMVRAAIDIGLEPLSESDDGLPLALVLVSRDIGHAFPTYVTPRVFLALWQANADGEEIEGTRIETTLGREIDFAASPWQEVFDTRVAPGESVRLDYLEARHPDATTVIGRVRVEPDYHYERVFAGLLGTLTNPDARAQIERAHHRTLTSGYVLAELRHVFPETVPSGPR